MCVAFSGLLAQPGPGGWQQRERQAGIFISHSVSVKPVLPICGWVPLANVSIESQPMTVTQWAPLEAEVDMDADGPPRAVLQT